MTDAELKAKYELLLILQELHIRKLLDRDKLDIKIEAVQQEILLDINTEP